MFHPARASLRLGEGVEEGRPGRRHLRFGGAVRRGGSGKTGGARRGAPGGGVPALGPEPGGDPEEERGTFPRHPLGAGPDSGTGDPGTHQPGHRPAPRGNRVRLPPRTGGGGRRPGGGATPRGGLHPRPANGRARLFPVASRGPAASPAGVPDSRTRDPGRGGPAARPLRPVPREATGCLPRAAAGQPTFTAAREPGADPPGRGTGGCGIPGGQIRRRPRDRPRRTRGRTRGPENSNKGVEGAGNGTWSGENGSRIVLGGIRLPGGGLRPPLPAGRRRGPHPGTGQENPLRGETGQPHPGKKRTGAGDPGRPRTAFRARQRHFPNGLFRLGRGDGRSPQLGAAERGRSAAGVARMWLSPCDRNNPRGMC